MIAQQAPYRQVISPDCAQHHFEKETSGILAIPTSSFSIHQHTNTNTDLLQYKVTVQSFHCFKIYFMSILFNLCGPCVLLGPIEFKRGSCIPRTGGTGGCEPMDLGIELWKNSKHTSSLLSHLSSPPFNLKYINNTPISKYSNNQNPLLVSTIHTFTKLSTLTVKSGELTNNTLPGQGYLYIPGRQ